MSSVTFRKRISVLTLLLLVGMMVFSVSAQATSFDDIMQMPDAEEEQDPDYVEFDTFIEDFIYYCESWGSEFDVSKKKTAQNNDGTVDLLLDEVLFKIRYEDDRHEILQVLINFSKPENGFQIDYSTLVKMSSLVAALEYEKPNTSAERASLLSSITTQFDSHLKTSMDLAKMGFSQPISFYNYRYSYIITYSDEEGYCYVVDTDKNEISNVMQSEDTQQKEDPTNTNRSEDNQMISLEICNFSVGKKGILECRNNTNQEISNISIRLRCFDKEGKTLPLMEDTAEDSSSFGGILNIFPVNGVLLPGETFEVEINTLKPVQIANKADISIKGFKYSDGKKIRIPESKLYWFSADTGYISNSFWDESYVYPEEEVFTKSGSILLGIELEQVFPELLDFYDVKEPGYFIYNIFEDSALRKNNIPENCVIISCNGISLMDDPFALEKAKAALVDGEALTLELNKGDEYMEVRCYPEDFE